MAANEPVRRPAAINHINACHRDAGGDVAL